MLNVLIQVVHIMATYHSVDADRAATNKQNGVMRSVGWAATLAANNIGGVDCILGKERQRDGWQRPMAKGWREN